MPTSIKGYSVKRCAEELYVFCGKSDRGIQRAGGRCDPRSYHNARITGDCSLDVATDIVDLAIRILPPDRLERCRLLDDPLYDPMKSFSDNVRNNLRRPGKDFPSPNELPICPTNIWGRSLSSPFGISASCLTTTPQLARYWSQMGVPGVTLKTRRTRQVKAHPPHNVAYLTEPAELIAPSNPKEFPLKFYVEPGYGELSAGDAFTIVNRFGIPSPEPAVWQRHLREVVRQIGEESLVMQSIVGTVSGDHSCGEGGLKALIRDTVECLRFVLQTDSELLPDAVEINLSCPNTEGCEKMLFENTKACARLCRDLRDELVAHHENGGKPIRMIAKIGYLPPEELGGFIQATHESLDGYAAINTVPCRIMQKGQHDRDVPFFSGSEMAGVSGIVIQECALEVIDGIAQKLSKLGYSRGERVIFGMGGITEPSDVRLYLDAGADIVQATTAFWHDRRFAVKVRQYLAGESIESTNADVIRDRKERAVRDATYAVFKEFAPVGELVDHERAEAAESGGNIFDEEGNADMGLLEQTIRDLLKLYVMSRAADCSADTGDTRRKARKKRHRK